MSRIFNEVDSMMYSSATDLIRGFRAHLAASGFDADALFAQAGLDERDCIADDAPTLSDKLSHLWELLLQVSGDSRLGLKLASPQPLDRSGLIGHIMRVSPDIRSAIENLVCYTPLVSPAMHSTLEQAAGRTRVLLDLPSGRRPVPRQRYDFIWSMALRALRSAAARDGLKPVLVSYAFPPPATLQAHVAAFGCEVRFDTPVNAMEFDDADLRAPIPIANPLAADWALRMLAELAQSQREWSVRLPAVPEQARPGASFSARVQQLLAGMLDKGEPLREEVARRLMMSERTLQRRLAEEGTNFTRLVDDTRRGVAQQSLGGGQVSLKKLSFQLGFSDPSAFCRACKRWFGLSPRQLRQRARAGGVHAAPALLPAARNPASDRHLDDAEFFVAR
jgi:AraC-like DNA-binding protein